MELRELRQQPHLSASSIGDYVECSLLYKFGRIDRLPMEGKSDALEFGTVIHLVLAEFYQARMVGDRMLLKDVHQLFEKHWRAVAEGNEDIRYSNGKDFQSLLMLGIDLLSIWHTKLPADNFRVVSIEEPFSIEHSWSACSHHRGPGPVRGRRIGNHHHHRLENQCSELTRYPKLIPTSS